MKETVGMRIRRLRRARLLTQQELARRAGYKSHVSIVRFEQDYYARPRPAGLQRIAAALQVSPEYLAHGDTISPENYPEAVREFLSVQENIDLLDQALRANKGRFR